VLLLCWGLISWSHLAMAVRLLLAKCKEIAKQIQRPRMEATESTGEERWRSKEISG
jgi:hypothetical protein